MSKHLFVRMMSLAVALLCAGQMSAQLPKALEVKELKLNNGMTVWLNEDHSQPKVFGAVVVNAGAKDCPNTGIAHYFEHIMFKGTEEIGTTDYAKEKPWLDSISAKYDQLAATKDEAARTAIQKDINRLSLKAAEYAIPNEFNNLISLYGGSDLNAGTSYDVTFYHNFFVPQYLEQWCLLNSDRLLNPVFRMFQSELETVYEEKNMGDDETMNNLREVLMKEAFGTNGYAYPVIGSTENLKNPKLSDMKAFYEKFYVASNMGLVLSGDFDSDNVLPLLERTFGRIAQGVKPTRVPSPMPDIREERTVTVKLPIPLISMEMLVFKSPTEYDKDANALTIATKLLSNGKAGKLDSLMNEGKIMAATIAPTSLNDAGFTMMLLLPNLLAKAEKAEVACLNEIKSIGEGKFDDEAFLALKQEAYRDALEEIETIEDRAMQMVMVMSSGHRWQEYLDHVNAIDKVTRADVVAAAKRYLDAPFLRLKKKYGSVEKDKVSQPGYTPVVSKNRNVESDYAKRLAAIPVEEVEPRLVDFEHDATTISLGGQAMLYTVKNPCNDLFNLTIAYNRGTKADPLLQWATGFANQIGTDSLTRQQLGVALQQLGASISFDNSSSKTTIEVTGVDKNFKPTMQLLSHFLQHAKSDEKSLKNIKDAVKADEKSLTEENTDVFRAMMRKVVYGNEAEDMHRVTYKEMKKMTGEQLLDALHAVQRSACDIVYSGNLANSEVEAAVRAAIPVGQSVEAFKDYTTETMGYDSPVVYVFDMPKTRQTIFFTYDRLKPLPSQEDRIPASLMEAYFGGGMSSVLFQEVREFRSMAYSTGSTLNARPRLLHPNSPLGMVNVVATQGDKAMSAIALVDSLLHDMPLVEKNFLSARQEIINDISNDFPTFREMGSFIASSKRAGFNADPKTNKARLLRACTMDDLRAFYENNLKNNAGHRVLGIIGSKKKLNLKELEKYGKVVVLKEKDLFRK